MKSTAAVVLGLILVACGGESSSPPPTSPTTPASAAAPTTPAPADTPAASAAATPATPATPAPPATPATPATPPAAPEKTFTHSKLGFSFSYADTLNVKEEAKGATVESAQPIAKVEDRSGKSKNPVDTKFVVRIIVEDGNIPAVAKKTNPSFADAFPKGQESAWKDQKDFAEKITTKAGNTAYSFVMGSHGNNEQDVFMSGKDKDKKTIVIKCSLTGDNFKPTMSAADQGKACEQIVSSLKP